MEQSNEASSRNSALNNLNDIERNVPNDSNKNSLFVRSMTFTSVTAKCDCDECCNVGGNMRKKISPIPPDIDSAIQNYKRSRITKVFVKRSQARSLIGRSSVLKDLAVWEVTMPSLAEPLIEYGNPLIYRIIWVKRLHKNLSLKQIGCGIIGSKNEEQGRKLLDWKENDVFLVSNIDQKAVGYVVEPAKLNDVIIDSKDAPPGPVVLCVAKIPSELIIHVDDDSDIELLVDDKDALTGDMTDSSASFEMIRRICSRALRSWKSNEYAENVVRLDMLGQTLFRKYVTKMLKKRQS